MSLWIALMAATVLGQGPGDLEDRVAEVLPAASEERWLAIPWRLDLDEARRDAQTTGKPLFLWIMNGHPFGCT
ncbi:MAG: hypothetical protein M9921_00635 [Fimbriimonadaceae bacterium]|nr:hypothetical protein [Chthonomonadaceae bacterium]MCO5295340.1 hypothetical protein [Fimbriimonadaceae bacterium]